MNKVIEPILILAGVMALLLLYLAGVGYQKEAFALGQAFNILRLGAQTGIAATTLIIFYIFPPCWAWRRFTCLTGSSCLDGKFPPFTISALTW